MLDHDELSMSTSSTIIMDESDPSIPSNWTQYAPFISFSEGLIDNLGRLVWPINTGTDEEDPGTLNPDPADPNDPGNMEAL